MRAWEWHIHVMQKWDASGKVIIPGNGARSASAAQPMP